MPPKIPAPALVVMATAALAALALAPSTAHADIVVEQAWTRATVPGATEAAGYLTIRNTGSEERTLLRLTSPITDRVTLHQSAIDSQGMARMWPVAKLELKPGQSVTFDPNGKHLMISNLTQPLRVGDTVPVTFQFDKGEAPVTALLQVRPLVDEAPPAAAGAHAGHHH
jgi:periplasmic copper chaperone A